MSQRWDTPRGTKLVLLRQLAPLSAVDPLLVYNLLAGYIHDSLLNGSSNPLSLALWFAPATALMIGDKLPRLAGHTPTGLSASLLVAGRALSAAMFELSQSPCLSHLPLALAVPLA